MFELMQIGLNNGIVETEQDWFIKIESNYRNSGKLKNGTINFQMTQMVAACKLHNCSMDWLCGLKESMTRNDKEYSAIELLKEGIRQLENASKKRVPKKKKQEEKSAKKGTFRQPNL